MCQRSNSSAKEVHRGRQQKRIGRQPLQSSSSSAAAAAAAVAAAGAETSNEEQFHYPSERIGCHWFGFHPDLLARLRRGSDGRP